jgi:hypothetical protein
VGFHLRHLAGLGLPGHAARRHLQGRLVSPLSLAEVDRRLADLRQSVERSGENLVALDGDVTRQTLAGSTALAGRTAAAWALADRQLADLWRGQLALADLLESLTRQRGTRSTLAKRDLARLGEALEGTPLSIATGEPAAGRPGLTASSTPTTDYSIVQLLAEMSAGYDSVVALLEAVGRVWNEQQPALRALGARLQALEGMAAATGQRPHELQAASRALEEAGELARTDPLALPDDRVAAVAAMLDVATGLLRDADDRRQRLAADLAGATSRLVECRGVLDRLAHDDQQGEAKVVVAGAAELGRWQEEADQLAVALASCSVAPDTVGPQQVAALLQRLERLAAEIDGARTATEAGVAQRDELRGRLEAYRAKAQALGRAEDEGLVELAAQAEDELYRAPCDLVRAEGLVDDYARAVRAHQEVGR